MIASRRIIGLISLIFLSLGMVACDFGSSSVSGDSASGAFNTDNCTIPTGRLVDGGVGKDGIPALTNPSLARPGDQGLAYLADTDRVIGVLVGGEPLAVPHNILWHHEVVNIDNRNGRTFAVTYCPLTGSSLVFDREAADGAEFGVSGLLFQNNLVMYDRNEEESLWPQMNRQANCGSAQGTSLLTLPAVEMTWGRWKALHPNSQVVTENTGFDRDYEADGYPYGDYEEVNNGRLLFDMPVDDRRPPKERLLGIPDGEEGGVALPFGALDADTPVRVVEVAVGGTQKTVFWSRAARTAMAFETESTFTVENGRIVDAETGSVWSVDGRAVSGAREGDQLRPVREAYVAFWFAWAAFQPETTIWTPSS
jgi:hypothetical protein